MSERDQFPTTITDIDDAAQFFENYLREQGTWNDMLPTNVGSFIKRIFAGLSVTQQHNIMMSARNAFYHTAKRDSAIYAIARGQGIYIERRISAATTATMKNGYTNTVFVPPYSQHTIGRVKFYNPVQYYVTAGGVAEAQLTQGEVRTKVFDLETINTALYEFVLGEPGFTVTSDLMVFTTDKNTGTVKQWSRTDAGLFEHTADDAVYYHGTTANGDASLTFGDGEYGTQLPKKATLTVRYIYSVGTQANDILPGVRVQYNDYPNVAGETIETTTGGADYKSAAYYRQYGPVMFRSRNKKISHEEIKGAINGYPGVADCAVLGQRDIAPEDKTWMNTLRVCVLPLDSDSWGGANPNPKSASWTNFLEWLKPQLHSSLEIQTYNATKVFVTVHVVVALFAWAATDAAAIKTQINENILRLFMKRPGILKRRVSKSDIEKACRVNGVDYIEVISPTERSIVLDDPTTYCVLNEQPLIEPIISERTDE